MSLRLYRFIGCSESSHCAKRICRATTHHDLVLRAEAAGIEVRVVHNASIMNAVAACGLQLYRFGETITVPFWTETYRPTSFYEKIARNEANRLHTLCLLDIKVKEQSPENLAKSIQLAFIKSPTHLLACRGIKVYEPPRFLTCAGAIDILLEIEATEQKGSQFIAFSWLQSHSNV